MPPPLSAVSARRRRERRYRTTLAVGLIASLALHGALVLLVGRIAVPRAARRSAPTHAVPAPEAIVVLELAEPAEGRAPESPRPEPREPEPEVPEPRRPEETEVVQVPREAEVAEPPPEREPPPAPEEERTNAERLRPRYGDPRLWVDPRDPRLYGERLLRFARADSAVRAILRGWLDSLQLTEEQRRRALDWTYEKDGKRWGISPEGLHLGDITIPIPFQLLPTGPQRRAFEQALRDLREIQLQDLRDDVEDVARERREEMRRRSREEAERRRGSDTTTTRREPRSRRPERAR